MLLLITNPQFCRTFCRASSLFLAKQLSRVPAAHPFPTLRLERADSIDSYAMEDIDASAGYAHHPAIKAPVAV